MSEQYVDIKLITGEEVVGEVLEDSDYEIKIMFPMLVKYIPRMAQGRIMESITLAPYTYFADSDIFTFGKNHIVYQMNLNPSHVDSYKLAVEDFIGRISEEETVANTEELKQTLDKLSTLFKDKIESVDDIDESQIVVNPSKLIH